VHVFETSATDLTQDIAPQLAHAAEPAIIIGGFELNELLDIGMWQDKELFGIDSLQERIGDLLGADHAGILVDWIWRQH